MTTSPPFTRTICATCERPEVTCICGWVTPLGTSVEIVILQHPLEIHQAKGSARLLLLSLHGSRLFSGELLSSEARHAILQPNRRAVLLYPDIPPSTAVSRDTSPLFEPDWLHQPMQLQLERLACRQGRRLNIITRQRNAITERARQRVLW